MMVWLIIIDSFKKPTQGIICIFSNKAQPPPDSPNRPKGSAAEPPPQMPGASPPCKPQLHAPVPNTRHSTPPEAPTRINITHVRAHERKTRIHQSFAQTQTIHFLRGQLSRSPWRPILRVRARARKHTYMHTYIHTYTESDIDKQTDIQTDIRTDQ